jgi:D-alanyl-D-alanine carboxypeptidase
MSVLSKNRIAIAAVLSVIILGGCQYPPQLEQLFSGDQPNHPPAAADANAKPAGEQLAKEMPTVDLAAVPAMMVLPPGAKQTLPHADGVTYESSAPDVVSVDSEGKLVVSPQATTGSQAIVTVTYHGERKQASVTVKASLADTVKIVNGVPTVTNPADLVVVVNKQRSLPAEYVPAKLVEPNVPFATPGKSEKRLLRPEAAKALEELFAQAKKENIHLYAVSGYRSYQTQKALYEGYVRTQGEEHASQYSARSGKSEHQTGLAMDVSGADKRTRLEESFADTPEGKWLAQHAAEFGFIIRYPKGKEAITGYAYEPWHIRYVGKEIAQEIAAKGITLEEYFGDATPVNKQY